MYEMTAEMNFLLKFHTTVHGPREVGDTYEQLVLAIIDAEKTGTGLSELLLGFGVTDLAGLLFLLRTVSIASAVETLRWASDETVGLAHLHGMATISHPAAMALHEPADDQEQPRG
ncbi:MAG: hypothetical protein JWM02_3509 [Frankiales bacterium]|nr:hypothetical protein [Frankiales bacterium]